MIIQHKEISEHVFVRDRLTTNKKGYLAKIIQPVYDNCLCIVDSCFYSILPSDKLASFPPR